MNPNNFIPAGGKASQVETFTIYDRPPAEMTALFERHVGFVGISTMLKAMGFTKGASQPTVGHYENPWQEDTVKVGSIVTASTGAGTDIIIALDADNMYNTSVTSGGAARQASYAQVGDVLELFDRTQVWIAAKNVTVNPHRLTLRPFNSTVDLAGKITAGDEYGIGYNLHAEASGLPAGRQKRVIKYTNTFGLVKHSFGATGFELTNAVYHETIPGVAESAGDSIYVSIKHDELMRYEASRSNLLLFGQQPDNITQLVTDTNLDTPVIGTEGLVTFALANGTIDEYTPGAYGLEDFDAIGNVYYDERATKSSDIITWDGPSIATETENAFTNVLVQNYAPFVDRIIDGYSSYMSQSYQEGLDGKGTDATLAFGYSCIQKNGFVFHMKRLSEFNDIKRFGGSAYPYRQYRIAMPIDWVNDMASGTSRSTIGYEYKELNGYSRENVFGSLPGAGVGGDNTPFGKAVNDDDSMKYFMMSHLAGHFACANAIVTQIPES